MNSCAVMVRETTPGHHTLHYHVDSNDDYFLGMEESGKFNAFPFPDFGHFWRAIIQFERTVYEQHEYKRFDYPLAPGDTKLESLMCDSSSNTKKMRCRLYGTNATWVGPSNPESYRQRNDDRKHVKTKRGEWKRNWMWTTEDRRLD